jgi:hypothetical protein
MKKSVKVYHLMNTSGRPIMYGTIKDVRKWAKDLWKTKSEYVQRITRVKTEEDFYYLMDGTVTLSNFLNDIGCGLIIVCEVSLEDFQE